MTLDQRIRCHVQGLKNKAAVSTQKAERTDGTLFADRHRVRAKALLEVARDLEADLVAQQH